jgi:hypothetical protein
LPTGRGETKKKYFLSSNRRLFCFAFTVLTIAIESRKKENNFFFLFGFVYVTSKQSNCKESKKKMFHEFGSEEREKKSNSEEIKKVKI